MGGRIDADRGMVGSMEGQMVKKIYTVQHFMAKKWSVVPEVRLYL